MIPNNILMCEPYPISGHPDLVFIYNNLIIKKNKLFLELEKNDLEYLITEIRELLELAKKLERLAYPAIFVEGFKCCKNEMNDK